eukprot:454944_1
MNGDTMLTNNGTLKIVEDDVATMTTTNDNNYYEDDTDEIDRGTMITVQVKEDEDEYVETQTQTSEKKYSGGGYSIGSFDGNTMVRQNSTDDEEEDPFQGQTMYRAPTVDSPHGPSVLLTDEEDNDSDNNSVIIANDNDTVTSMGTTKPAMSVSPKNAFIAPNGTMHMMSDDEEDRFENTRGYANKPSSPLSGETKSQPPMAKVKRLNQKGRSDDPPITPSDTPQPEAKGSLVMGTAGPMGGSIAAETKRHSVRQGRISGGTHDVEIPTSPIPHYKHMQMLTDDTKADGDTFYLKQIQQLAILANQLDFSRLVSDMPCMQHVLVIIAVLTTWIFIVSYITLECSDRKRPREMQLFLFASAVSILFNLVFNPFYFKTFANKYVPMNIEQLFERTQPRFACSSLGLRVTGHSPDVDGARKLKHSDDISDTASDDSDHITKSPRSCIFTTFVILLRGLALIGALGLSYYIYLDLSIELYTDFTRYCIVALTLLLFVGNLPLMGHCMLYFRKTFLLYYLIGWLVVFSSEFAYFHFVRHVEEEYFDTFIIMNVIFFAFHLVTTLWFSHMVKHRTLYLLDPLNFPNSNHYRVYFANTAITLDRDGYNTTKHKTSTTTHHTNDHHNTIGFRTVQCCCNKLICDSHTLLRFQSYACAVSFWSFLGIIYTVGFDYVVLSASLFMLINTVWNPLFYSKQLEYIYGCKKGMYYLMLILSYIVGCVLNIAWCTFSISAFILEDG